MNISNYILDGHDVSKLFDTSITPISFSDDPRKHIPKNGSIIYSVWDDNEKFIYIGISGLQKSLEKRNPLSRMISHASGVRSGDQFCVYVSDRLVMKNLTDEQIKGISQGTYSLDHQIRDFIRTELSYRYALVPDDPTARALGRYGLQIAKGQGAELLNTL